MTDVPLVDRNNKNKNIHTSTECSASMQIQSAHLTIHKRNVSAKTAKQSSAPKDTPNSANVEPVVHT